VQGEISMDAAITHCAVYAKNLEKTRDYYLNYFGGKSNDKYENAKGFSSYFISFHSGTRLEVMYNIHLEEHTAKEKESGWSHIAFSVGSKEAVIELTNQIASDGYEVFSQPRETGDGYFESCVSDPDGNRVEITE
jgi:lactoylglutathione lyase